jgi:hypothetical protein
MEYVYIRVAQAGSPHPDQRMSLGDGFADRKVGQHRLSLSDELDGLHGP